MHTDTWPRSRPSRVFSRSATLVLMQCKARNAYENISATKCSRSTQTLSIINVTPRTKRLGLADGHKKIALELWKAENPMHYFVLPTTRGMVLEVSFGAIGYKDTIGSGMSLTGELTGRFGRMSKSRGIVNDATFRQHLEHSYGGYVFERVNTTNQQVAGLCVMRLVSCPANFRPQHRRCQSILS